MTIINEEIKKWEDRIYFGDLKFKEENTKPGSTFYKLIKKLSNDILDNKFRIVACEYESQTYKIARLLIEKFRFVNEEITFDLGVNLESYIGNENGSVWSLQEKVKEYLNKNKNHFKNKIVIIPLITFKIDKVVAIYLADQLEVIGAKALIFSYEDNNADSLMHTLALNSYNKMVQFPKVSIQERGRKIKDDGF